MGKARRAQAKAASKPSRYHRIQQEAIELQDLQRERWGLPPSGLEPVRNGPPLHCSWWRLGADGDPRFEYLVFPNGRVEAFSGLGDDEPMASEVIYPVSSVTPDMLNRKDSL